MEGLIEPTQTPYTPKHIVIASSLSKVDNGNRVIVQVMNISPGNITLCKGAPLSEFIPIHDVFFVDSNHDTQTEHILSLIVDVDLSSSNLSIRDKQRLHNVLCTFRDVFATTGEALGHTSVIKHAVKTTGPPIHQPMFRLPVV